LPHRRFTKKLKHLSRSKPPAALLGGRAADSWRHEARLTGAPPVRDLTPGIGNGLTIQRGISPLLHPSIAHHQR